MTVFELAEELNAQSVLDIFVIARRQHGSIKDHAASVDYERFMEGAQVPKYVSTYITYMEGKLKRHFV